MIKAFKLAAGTPDQGSAAGISEAYLLQQVLELQL
jgi:hypothetical protein